MDVGYRVTHSKRVFLPYVTSANAEFDLAKQLRDCIACDDISNTKDPLPVPPTQSPHSRELSPSPSSPPNDDMPQTLPSPSHTLHPTDSCKRQLSKKKITSHASRKRARMEKKAVAYSEETDICPSVSARYNMDGPQVQCDMEMDKARVARMAFVALNDKVKPDAEHIYALAEVTGEGSLFNFKLQEWDGCTSILILDKSRRVIAVLAGWPDDEDWPSVHKEAADTLESQQPRCSTGGGKQKKPRGQFTMLTCGISHGGGQTHPMNLKHVGANKDVLEELNSMSCFKRIAGFASAAMKNCMPDLYRYYAENLSELHDKNPALKRPFSSSVFSAATYNLGPQTVCFKHRDCANLPFGWCAVMSLGLFDYKKVLEKWLEYQVR